MDQAAVIAIIVATVVLFIIVLAIIGLVVFLIRYRRKQNQEYVRLQIEQSLSRKVVTGPTVPEKRDDALMNARYYLRDSNFELDSPLWKIGTCGKKYSFLVKNRKGKYIMTLQAKGPNCYLAVKTASVKQNISNLLTAIKHPFILPTVEASFLPGQQKCVLITFRTWAEKKGSLKDLIFQTKPGKPYDEKYGKRVGKALQVKDIRQYGRQILEALQYFHLIGYEYPDLHPGNIIVINGICKLTDYDNVLMGQKPHYAEFSRDQNQMRDFGCLLFEMACGYEPSRKDIRKPPPFCNPQVVEIIHSIFLNSPSATLEEVVVHPFFNVVPKGISAESGEEMDMRPEFTAMFDAIKAKTPIPKSGKISKNRAARQQRASQTMSGRSLGTPKSESTPTISKQSSPAGIPPAPMSPPPPPMTPPPQVSRPPTAPPPAAGERSQLLSSIRTGTKLKSAGPVNDRSKPLL